jgi:hypothetical protein
VARPGQLLARRQQPARRLTAATGEVAHDVGDLVAVGLGGVHPLLRPHDAGRRDELLGACDLLDGLDAADAAPQDPVLAAGH